MVLHEFADGRLDFLREARVLIERSRETVEQVVARYEKQKRQEAAQALSRNPALAAPFYNAPPPPQQEDSKQQHQHQQEVEEEKETKTGNEETKEEEEENGFVDKPPAVVIGRAVVLAEEEEETDDEREPTEEEKRAQEAAEERYMTAAVAAAVGDEVRIAQLLTRHNHFRVIAPRFRPPVPISQAGDGSDGSGDGARGSGLVLSIADGGGGRGGGEKGSPGGALSNSSVISGVTMEGDIERASVGAAAAAEEEEDCDDNGGDEHSVASSLNEEDAALAEELLHASLALYEASPKALVDEATKPLGGQLKLSPFIGIEQLGPYPPPEFEVIWAARRAAEAAAKAEAARRRAARKEEKRRKFLFLLNFFFLAFYSLSCILSCIHSWVVSFRFTLLKINTILLRTKNKMQI